MAYEPKRSKSTFTLKIIASYLILAVLVGVSRVAVGAHFPSDVLGAWFIGSATFGLMYANKRGSKGDAGHEPSKHPNQ